MPSTINGIGTWYYGKSNFTQREGECHSCHRHVYLSSYDTRLYFVVFFIPVIPLGRKRIVDECSMCRRHYAIGADQYQQMSTDSIDKGMQQFKDDPSAETALGVHGRLVAFQKFDEAREFRAKALEYFGNDAEFMIELAAQLDEMSRTQELIPILDRILAVDPDNKMIRARQAVLLSQRGDIDRARPLLDYLEKPGAFVDSSPAPLVHLADMFSRQGRHDDALQMLEHMVRELPDLGKDAAFRRMVLGIEKKAGRTASIVPAPKNTMLGLLNPFNQDIEPGRRRAAWIAAGVVALLALLAGINYYISQHRQIHIVNGFRQDLQVSINGAPPIVVRPGQTLTPIREGKHKAKVTGGIEEELDFEVRAGYFARFFRKPAWVLVPGEGVILQKSNLIYAQNPEPGTNEFFFAKGLLYIPHCDYPFVEPPQTIDIGKNPKVKKTALALGTFSPEDVAAFVFAKDPEAAMRYLEQHLANNPAYEALGHTYIYFGNRLKEQNRVARFLREGLDKRPVVIAWHRNWSWLLESMGQTDEAFAYYDAAIKAEGESAPLLYLRSRVDPDAARSVESLATAMKLERSFPWLWYAEGNAALSSGDFPLAKKHFENAAELGVPLSILEDQVFLARLGAGEGPQLVTELQQKVQHEALNAHHIEQLTAALIANGSPDEARQAFEKWAQHPSVRNVMSNAYLDRMREQLMFRLGDLPGLEKALQQSRPGASDYDPYRREYLMVVGRANDVEVLPADDFSLSRKEMFGLEMALACHIAGDLERSKGWAEDVAKAWETQSGFERKGAEYLRAEKAPPYEEFAATRLSYFDKGLLAALIARRFPAESEPFAQLARKLTIARGVGSLVVAKALDSQ